jgi:hypothetical protein
MTSVVNPQIKETKQAKNSVYQLLAFTLLGIFVAQIFIHLIFHFKPDLEHFIEMILSSFLMVIFLFPFLYRFVVQPLSLEIAQRKQAEEALEKTIFSLQEAVAKVKTLSGLLPICASCKKIRDDRGYWNQIETYISDHSEADFSHGLCPECAEKLYPGLDDKK